MTQGCHGHGVCCIRIVMPGVPDSAKLGSARQLAGYG